MFRSRTSLCLLFFAFHVAWSEVIEINPPVIEPDEEVTFTCQGKKSYLQCTWEYGDDGAPFLYAEYEIDKDDVTSCNFRMNVNDEDFSSVWKCKLIYSQGEYFVGSANLTIARAPQAPEMKVVDPDYGNEEPVGNMLTVTEGVDTELVCYSREGRPAAEISWLIANETAVGGEEDFPCQLREDIYNDTGRSFPLEDTVSRVVCRFRPEDNTRDLVCVADHPFPENGNETAVTLNVEFSPVVFTFDDSTAYDGFLAAGNGGFQFYTVDINARVELKLVVQANPEQPRVFLEAPEAFGSLAEGDENGRFSLRAVEKYIPGDNGPPTDRTDLYVATFVIDPTRESDFNVEYSFRAENDFCQVQGRDCVDIKFSISEGDKVDNSSSLSGGAIAGIVLACLAVLIVILIVVVAKMRRALCFGDGNHKAEGSETESSAGGAHDGEKPAFSTRLVNLFRPKKVLKKDLEANKEETEMLEKRPPVEGGEEKKKDEGVVYAELDLKKGGDADPPKKESTEYSEIVGTAAAKK